MRTLSVSKTFFLTRFMEFRVKSGEARSTVVPARS